MSLYLYIYYSIYLKFKDLNRFILDFSITKSMSTTAVLDNRKITTSILINEIK